MLRIGHVWQMALFALLVSIAFACVGGQSLSQRIKHAIWSFALFMLIGIGIAWLMYPFSR